MAMPAPTNGNRNIMPMMERTLPNKPPLENSPLMAAQPANRMENTPKDEIDKNINYLVTHQHKDLTLVVHPILFSYFTKGNLFMTSKAWKWRWKHGQKIKVKENTSYHLTEFHFFDKHEEEIKL